MESGAGRAGGSYVSSKARYPRKRIPHRTELTSDLWRIEDVDEGPQSCWEVCLTGRGASREAPAFTPMPRGRQSTGDGAATSMAAGTQGWRIATRPYR